MFSKTIFVLRYMKCIHTIGIFYVFDILSAKYRLAEHRIQPTARDRGGVSYSLPFMLTGVRNGTCSINWRSGENHILSGCPGITAVVVCSPTVPTARSDSRQLYAWQSSASGTDSIQQLQSAVEQRWPFAYTNRPASSTDTKFFCADK